MNYYPFHIGDYRSATIHLNDLEDLAYRRLIDLYMDTESPICLDLDKVSRLIRSRRDTLQVVLDDFFILGDDGWHHKRCDSELEKYKSFQTSGKVGAAKRWAKKNSPPIDSLLAENSPPMQTLIATKNQEPIKNTLSEISNSDQTEEWISSKGKIISGDKLVWFKNFWEVFGDKNGRAKAIDSFLSIKGLNYELAKEIYLGAKKYAEQRREIKAKGGTPKMAQGWLTDRRWEDEVGQNKSEWI